MNTADDYVLADTLALAVPFRVMELRRVPAWERRLLVSRAAAAVANQGDSLMFGSGHAFGHGTAQLAAHQSGMHARRAVAGGRDEDELVRTCSVCAGGAPQYSAGEVFSQLVTGLACAAMLPGGVSFAGLHWCTALHEGCPNVPPVPEGEAGR